MSVKQRNAPAASVAGSGGAGAVATAPLEPMDYAALLVKLGTKDRLNVEKHVAACDAEPDESHSKNYRRLLTVMAGLAPHAAKTHGQQAVQFYVPDGKYRMQVLALQDQRDGVMSVYCDDLLDAALKAGLLSGPTEVADVNNSYRIKDSVDSLKIDRLDGKSASPAPFYKDMLGWNRRAVRITLPATATAEQVKVTETLIAMAALKWQPKEG